MSLASGTRLGPYEVLGPIGAGGMGEVYKARDTRLDRTVALKILPPELSADPDRRARFEREAKTIAGLNHPHICTLHDVGEHEGTTFLVMELLQGETLADRLLKGRLPVDQALTVATEIADALAAAHKQGIIHRDLKPANVMLTKAGAKLLDFGLAKLAGHGAEPAAAHLASAATRSAPLTAEGTIVGTLQYMAPEQIEGKAADARTDLWALGAILYEMLTGKRAFEGTSAASLIGNIMNAESAPVQTLQPLTPPALDRVVTKCLAKHPDDRWDTAHDVADELRWILQTSGASAVAGGRRRHRDGFWAVLAVAGGLAMAFAGAGVMSLLRPAAPGVSLTRPSMDVRPAGELNAGGVGTPVPTPGGSRTALTWTPDAQALVFVGRRGDVQQLYVRRLDAAEARPLAGTEGAQVPTVSPDGQSVAFWATGTIRTAPLASGGPVTTICEGPRSAPFGMAWGSTGRFVYASDGRLWQVPGGGGVPETLMLPRPDGVALILPHLLPGDQTVLCTERRRSYTWGDEQVAAYSLVTHRRTVVLSKAVDARYVASGHLVFLTLGALFAVPFDPQRLQVLGDPVGVLDGVAQALTGFNQYDVTGAGQMAIAPTGALAYVVSPLVPPPEAGLVRVDRHGTVTPLSLPVKSYGVVSLSPDGGRVAVDITTPTEQRVWIHEPARPNSLAPLSPQTAEAEFARWTPNGERLAFTWRVAGAPGLAWMKADASGPAELLASGPLFPMSWSSDGKRLAVAIKQPDGTFRMALLSPDEASHPLRPLTPRSANEHNAAFAPDGRCIGYESDESGQREVYLQPDPGPGRRVQVSVGGGRSPAWNPRGGELFYVEPPTPERKSQMMVVDVRTTPTLKVGAPRPLFELKPGEMPFGCEPMRCYDVAPDGQSFVVARFVPQVSRSPVTHINLILNWLEELKAKVPAGGAGK